MIVLAGYVEVTVMINKVVSAVAAALVSRVGVWQFLRKSLTGKFLGACRFADVNRFNRPAASEEDHVASDGQAIRPPAIVQCERQCGNLSR